MANQVTITQSTSTLTWSTSALPTAPLLAGNNLSELTNPAAAQSNLGLPALLSGYVTLVVGASGDTSGATDTPRLQAALTAGGRVTLPPGTFWVNATLNLPSNVTVTGAGKGITILKAAAGLNAPVISNVDQVNGNFYIALKSFTVDGNKTTMTGFPYTGVYLHGCGHVVYEDFEVQNSSNVGIYMDGLALVSSRYVWLTNVEAHDNIGSGIQISNATRATHMAGVYAYNNGTHGVFWDMSESTANGLYAYNNTDYGIYIRNVFNCVLNNLNATRNGEHGIYAVALTDSVGSDWMAIENGANGPEPGGGWADIYFDPTGTPTWGYGTTNGTVISGVRAGALMALSHNWKPNGIVTPTNVPDYGVYLGDGINGNVTLRDVLIGSVGVQKLRMPTAPGNIVVALAGDPAVNSTETMFIKDDFASGSTGNTAIGELSWSYTNIGPTAANASAGHPGIINHSVTTSGMVASLRLGGSNNCDLVPADMFDCTFIIRVTTVSSTVDLRFGIGDASGMAPPTDGIFIEKAYADTSWFGTCRSGGTQTRTSALATVNAATWVKLRVRRIDSATIGFTVDNGTEQTVTTNIPTSAMAFFTQVTNNDGVLKGFDFDYFEATVSGLGR